MSLINQMLQDLELRNASAGMTAPMSGEVRAVPSARPAQQAWLMGLVLVLVLAGVSAWIYLNRMTKPVLPDTVKVTPASVPVAVAAEKVLTPPAATVAVGGLVPAAEVRANTPVPSDEAAGPVRRSGDGRVVASVASATPRASRAHVDHAAETASLPESVTALPAAPEAPAVPETAAPASTKQKAAARTVPGNAGTSIKLVSPLQQSDNFYRQAILQLQAGRLAEAQDSLRKALDANPVNLKARQTLVGLLVEGKHDDEAMTQLQEGLKLTPEQSGFCMALARLQVEAGNATGAMDTLERGLKYAGDDADYHAFYAALLQREERHDEAIAHYLIALKSNPSAPVWLVGIAISLQAQGKLADAGEAYRRARDTGQLTPQMLQFVEQRLKQIKPLH